MVKLWISDKLELRYSPDGWPDINKWHPGHGMKQDFLNAMDQAKEDSILFEIQAVFYPIINACTTPDTFIDYAGEVETGWQYYLNGEWRNASEESVNRYANEGAKIRQVARLKKAENAAHGYTEGSVLAEEAKLLASFTEGPDANDKDVASIDPGVGEKPEIEKVREQLAAANKRIKELEDFIVEFYDTVTRIN